MTPDVRQALAELVTAPVLLVACDYDGTLAEIVDDPERAMPVRESIIALRSLASLADTHVAVVSGRALRDLASLSRLPHEVHLVGSHGSEFDADFARLIDDQSASRLATVGSELTAIAGRHAGTRLERKPASIALHYRTVAADDLPALLVDVDHWVDQQGDVQVKRGKKVVELSVIETNKGMAVHRLRQLVGADAVLFLGDDVTDEDAFAALSGPDVAIKVGEGPSRARLRVDGPAEVSRLLAMLFERRRAWLQGEAATPIERHSLLSDQRVVALLTPDARVTWLCHPRADSPALMAELLGGPSAGVFAVAPEPNEPPLDQRYVDDSLVVETRWRNVRVVDYLDASRGRPFEAPGRSDLVRVVEGRGAVTIDFAPRLDFGRVPTQLEVVDDGLFSSGSAEIIHLRSPDVVWTIVDEGQHQRAQATVTLQPGQPLVLEMRLGAETAEPVRIDEPDRRRATLDYWSGWTSPLQVGPLEPDLIRRSALMLKSLCHQPSGAILAAATTSLPESVGGVRNWDYRYCWPRDAAVAAGALVALGSTAEAFALLDWLEQRVANVGSADRLRPLYPLTGDEFTPEAVIPTLAGYLGSRPVRIGNLAEHQLQLDMFGPIVDLVRQLCRLDAAAATRYWEFTAAVADAVCRRWSEPDHGIWEERRARRHHVHSRVMCWLVLTAAQEIASLSGRPLPDEWQQGAKAIRDDVETNGWDDEQQTFTAAYGEPALDASLLQLAIYGFLDGDDPRMEGTVAAVERELRRGATVYRYLHDDGLPGREGGFLVCATWLVEALVKARRMADARTLFDRVVDLAGPTGLLAEQYDPDHELCLGNVPQAYSHAGLIYAALALTGRR